MELHSTSHTLGPCRSATFPEHIHRLNKCSSLCLCDLPPKGDPFFRIIGSFSVTKSFSTLGFHVHLQGSTVRTLYALVSFRLVHQKFTARIFQEVPINSLLPLIRRSPCVLSLLRSHRGKQRDLAPCWRHSNLWRLDPRSGGRIRLCTGSAPHSTTSATPSDPLGCPACKGGSSAGHSGKESVLFPAQIPNTVCMACLTNLEQLKAPVYTLHSTNL